MPARDREPAVEVGLLGPVRLLAAGRVVGVGGSRQRALLAALTLRGGQLVRTEELGSALWGEDAPPSAPGSLRGHLAGAGVGQSPTPSVTAQAFAHVRSFPWSVTAWRGTGCCAAGSPPDSLRGPNLAPARRGCLCRALHIPRNSGCAPDPAGAG